MRIPGVLVLAVVTGLVGVYSSPTVGPAFSPPDDGFLWHQVAPPEGSGLRPVAATVCDRDRDGEADLAVAYAGPGRGALLWLPVVGDQVLAAEAPIPLDFEPSALVAGDLDADGQEELAFASAGEPRLMVLEIEPNGGVTSVAAQPLPGVPLRLETRDLPRCDGLPDLVVDLPDYRIVAAGPLGALEAFPRAGLVPLPDEAQKTGEIDSANQELLRHRIDADAIAEVVVTGDDGSLWLKSLQRATLVVTTTDDHDDGTCDADCSLREAVNAANAAAGPHTIAFDIPEAGNDFHDNAWWFSPSDGNLGPLPPITMSGVTIDGSTQTVNQSDSNPDGPELVLDGSGLASTGSGLAISASNVAILDLVISGFPESGIWVGNSDGAVVAGCYIGTSPDGLAAAPNLFGIMMVAATTGATIGGTGTHGPGLADGNLISGNPAGVWIEGAGSEGNTVLGNLIGTDRHGSTGIGSNGSGVRIVDAASSNTIGGTAAGAGNTISGNAVAGVIVEDSGTDGNVIQGNLIGTTSDGSAALGNGLGIRVRSAATNTTVGGGVASARNLISGNGGYGVRVEDPGTAGTVIEGSWVGLDSSGAAALPNGSSGIAVRNGATATTIGGTTAGRRNLISGNAGEGIAMWDGGTSGNQVLGNWIGLDSSGGGVIANGGSGIVFFNGGGGPAHDNTVGGTDAGAGNVIVGHGNAGIRIDGGAYGIVVEGNFVGTDEAGSSGLGNEVGVRLANGASGNSIGAAGYGNVISGNSTGIRLEGGSTHGNTVEGNLIGLAPDGLTPLGNATGIAADGCGANTVGGVGAAADEIAHSGGTGIAIVNGALDVTVSRCSIHENGGLGIDLEDDGVTANDAGDSDDGSNHLVNYPVLLSAVIQCGGGGLTTVTGSVDSPGLVELFASVAADSSGFGEGQTFIGSTSPATAGSFSVGLPRQAAGTVITATFRDAAGNTSELSNAILVESQPLAPTGLQAVLAAGPAVDLSWLDNASIETVYRLERRRAGEAGFSFLVNLPADTTAFRDVSPLEPGATYFYRLRAEGGGCVSGWSNEATALVPGSGSDFCRTRLTRHLNAAWPYVAYGDGFLGVTWQESDGGNNSIVYARLDSTGAILTGPVEVAPWADESSGSQLVWSGSLWGHLWFEHLADEWALMFRRLDADGLPLSPAIRVNGSSELVLDYPDRNRGLAWDGSGWGIVWRGEVDGVSRVYYSHLDSSDTVDVAERTVDDSLDVAVEPKLAFDGSVFGLVWYDTADGQFHFRSIATDGTPAGPSVLVTSSAIFGGDPDFAWNGSEYGLTWTDQRDDDNAVYFRRLDASGAPLSDESRLSDASDVSTILRRELVLRFADDRWVVASGPWRSSGETGEVELSFADFAGAKMGPDVVVSGPADIMEEAYPALAWNGSTLLSLWSEPVAGEAFEIVAQATDRDGDPGANPRQQLTSGHVPGGRSWRGHVNLVPTGSGFAVTWFERRPDGLNPPYLMLVDGDGTPTTGAIPVPDAPVEGYYPTAGPPVAFSGEVLAVARSDADGRLYLSRFDANGGKIAGDLQVSTGVRSDRDLDLIWTGEVFLAAWTANPDGRRDVFTAAIAADGTVLASDSRISNAPGWSFEVALAGNGRARAVAWADNRSGDYEIYAAPLDRLGRRCGPERRITNDGSSQDLPALAFNGEEFLLTWRDGRSSPSQVHGLLLGPDATPSSAETVISDDGADYHRSAWNGSTWGVAYHGEGGIWYAELDAGGSKLGADRMVLSAHYFNGGDIAWDGRHFAVTVADGNIHKTELYLTSVPCGLDATPPSCPTGLGADSTTGDVTLEWTPGSDEGSAVLWQAIARDGVRFAVVGPGVTSWTDSPAPQGIHHYAVTVLSRTMLESAGCQSVSVYTAGTCFASRDLPDLYVGGQGLVVSLGVTPPAEGSAYAVEEEPPAGWTVSDVDNGGSFDPATAQVKWVFYDSAARTLTYRVTPPAGTHGVLPFSGRVSVDGGSQPICGDTAIDSGPLHPADLGDDWSMGMDEVTAYAAAWVNGADWPRPPLPIPVSYVTNAAFLWIVGELYTYDPAADPPYSSAAPGRSAEPGHGTASSTFSSASYAPGEPITVSLVVTPDGDAHAYAVEDAPPAGWAVSEISSSGQLDPVNGKVKWGPFYDNLERELDYTTTPPLDAAEWVRFTGTASFDGNDHAIEGERLIGVLGLVFADDFETGDTSAWAASHGG